MTQAVLIYVACAAGALTLLTHMILRIGALMATCPDNGPTARAASITIATGHVAIGAGGIMLIGTLLPLLRDAPYVALLATLGIAALCLGLGFAQTMATLRAVIGENHVSHGLVASPDTSDKSSTDSAVPA